jgi:hypothetical protein
MEHKAIGTFVMLGFLAAAALYSFDPWLGVASGMAVALISGVFLIAAQTMKGPQKRRFTSDFSVEEEEEQPRVPNDEKNSRPGSG